MGLGPTACDRVAETAGGAAHDVRGDHEVKRQPEPGRFEWTSPTGHTYTVEPEPLGPVHDPPEPDRAPDGDTGLDRDTGLDPPPF